MLDLHGSLLLNLLADLGCYACNAHTKSPVKTAICPVLAGLFFASNSTHTELHGQLLYMSDETNSGRIRV